MDNKSLQEILLQWAQFADYDPEQTSFDLLTGSYDLHRCGKKITQIQNNLDPTGVISALYAKKCFRDIHESISVKLWDLVENPEALRPYVSMWKSFCSPAMVEAEDYVIDMFNRLVSEISGTLQIGEEDREKSVEMIYGTLPGVIDDLDKLNIETYKKGAGRPDTKLPLLGQITVFATLADCLLALEKSRDGIYICYISQYGSSDGYFGMFLKSGGYLLSVNDRVNEAFIGQHKASRNGRWSEGHAFGIFPYDAIVDAGGYDYLGYASKYETKEEAIRISQIERKDLFPLLLFIALIQYNLSIRDIESMPLTYTNILLASSLAHAQENTPLPAVIHESQIAAENRDPFILKYGATEVAEGSLNEYFDRKDDAGWEENRYKGVFGKPGTIFTELYSEGFALDEKRLVRYDAPQITDGEKDEGCVSEFVGPAEKFELEKYRQARKQFADHIRENMRKEYENFGGEEGIRSWYKQMLAKHTQRIIEEAAKGYKEIVIDKTRKNGWASAWSVPISDVAVVTVSEGTHPADATAYIVNEASREDYRYFQYVPASACPITGTKANVWITIQPCTYLEMERIFAEEVPKVVKGWKNTKSPGAYAGNSLLEATDSVARIASPITSSFTFAVGFSKRGIKRLIRSIEDDRKNTAEERRETIVKGEKNDD